MNAVGGRDSLIQEIDRQLIPGRLPRSLKEIIDLLIGETDREHAILETVVEKKISAKLGR